MCKIAASINWQRERDRRASALVSDNLVIGAIRDIALQRQVLLGVYDALWSIRRWEPAWSDLFLQLHVQLTMEVHQRPNGNTSVWVPNVADAIVQN